MGRSTSPWAYDAAGRAVPTYYVADGSRLIQVVRHDVEGIAYPVVADPRFQFDCGIITCTLRFDRNTTNDVMLGLGISTLASALAAFLGPIGVVAAAVIGTKLGLETAYANWVYNRGNCIGFKMPVYGIANPLGWWTTEVAYGTYNCR